MPTNDVIQARLRWLRNGSMQAEQLIADIRAHLNKVDGDLASIDTSEDELARCLAKSHLRNAKHWRDTLRRGTLSYAVAGMMLQRHLREGGYTLSDIGMTQTEFKQLCSPTADTVAELAKQGRKYKRHDEVFAS